MKKIWVLILIVMMAPMAAMAAGGTKVPHQEWSFEAPFGSFDRAAMQRGLQVYKEVCAACHSLKYVAYRNLADLGYNEDQIKSFAAEFTVMDGPNEEGEMYERPARPSDRFAAPYANDNAARAANGGALPPDLSLITKARVSGPDYLYALLTGYDEPPADMVMMPGMNYNHYFAGHQIAMPAPLIEGGVSYADGTEATVDQMAKDVTHFLHWAAEPQLEARHRMGIKVLIFLGIAAILFYYTNRRIWAKIKKK